MPIDLLWPDDQDEAFLKKQAKTFCSLSFGKGSFWSHAVVTLTEEQSARVITNSQTPISVRLRFDFFDVLMSSREPTENLIDMMLAWLGYVQPYSASILKNSINLCSYWRCYHAMHKYIYQPMGSGIIS
jgi:hypothetical protein